MALARIPALDPQHPSDVAAFIAGIAGTVVRPEDAAYDEARQVHLAQIDRRPAMIVQAANAGDVARTVMFARETGLELAVRGGSHSLAGHSTSEGGIVLDLGGMKGLHIDPERRLAWAQPGLRAEEYTVAAAAHGLATPFGDTGSVGIAGLTLGGGIGWLARKHGLAIDALVSVELVTADGRLITASETEHPDLFWAVRGGGGNFGVVTRFQYRLYPVSVILGGALFMPADQGSPAGPRADRRERPRGADHHLVPDGRPAGAVHPGRDPLPAHPRHHVRLRRRSRVRRGRPEPVPRRSRRRWPSWSCRCRTPASTRCSAAPSSAARRPIARCSCDPRRGGDRRDPRPPRGPELADGDDPDPHPRRRDGPGRCRPRRPSPIATPRSWSRSITPFMDPAELPVHTAWTQSYYEALRPNATGVYANFLEDEGDARIREAYPTETYRRLADVKRRYDPTNLFHLNQNIAPAIEA